MGRRRPYLRALALLIPAMLAAASGPSAQAQAMRLSYVATVGAFGGVDPFAGEGLALGDPYTVSFTFDPQAGDVISTPYHAIENTPSGPIDHGYFGDNILAYGAPGSGPLEAGLVRVDIAFGGGTLTLDEVDYARFYASGQPGAEGYLAVEAEGVLPGGELVDLTDAIFAPDIVPLLTAAQIASPDGNPSATAVIATADGAVLGRPDGATLEAVPEPSGWALAIGGGGLVGWSLRRRRAIDFAARPGVQR